VLKINNKMLLLALFAVLIGMLGGCNSEYYEGYPWNESRQCWGPLEQTDSMQPAGAYGSAITYARSPDGRYWQFPSTGIPDDFVVVRDRSPESVFPQSDERCE